MYVVPVPTKCNVAIRGGFCRRMAPRDSSKDFTADAQQIQPAFPRSRPSDPSSSFKSAVSGGRPWSDIGGIDPRATMRSLRPPPKVTPPKPPAHLFEPREEPPTNRLVNQQGPASPSYEDDVKYQMQKLEEEMKSLLDQEKALYAPGPNPSQGRVNPGRPGEPAANGGYKPPARSKGDPFAPRINPADWKSEGYPSEFAYMKAMGQLDITNAPPGVLTGAEKIPLSINAPDYTRPQQQPQMQMRQQPISDNRQERANDQQKYEREMVSPARRKGGAIQNLFNSEENLRRKFASQHEYSDILQRQAEEQRLAKETELLAHRGLRHPQQGGVVPIDIEQMNGMHFPSEQRKPQRAAPVPTPAPGPAVAAPNGAQFREDFGARSMHPAASLGVDTSDHPREFRHAGPAPADRGYREAPAPYDRVNMADPALQRSQYEAVRSLVAPAPTQQSRSPPRRPVYEPSHTSLPLGMDKKEEVAKKRAQQEEYRRQLDALKPRTEVIPAVQSAMVDSSSYLHTGVRPAPERAMPAAAAENPYRYAPPPQRGLPRGMEAASAASYRPDPYRDTGGGPAERMAPASYLDSVRDVRGAPGPQRGDADMARYHDLLQRSRADPPAPTRLDPDQLSDPYAARRRYESPVPAQRYEDLGRGPLSEEDMYRAMLAQRQAPSSYDLAGERGAPRQAPPQPAAVPPPSVADAVRSEKEARRQQQEAYKRELERQMNDKKALKEQSKREQELQDQKFLQSIAGAQDNNPPRRKKAAGAQGMQPPIQEAAPVRVEGPPRGARDAEAPGRAAPAQSGYGGAASRADFGRDVDEDAAAEYAYMKARAMMAGAGEHGRDRSGSEERYYDERSDRGGAPAGYRADPAPRDLHREFQDREEGRHPGPDRHRDGQGLHLDPHATAEVDESPNKSPNQARTRFMKDIYGSDLISHDPQRHLDHGAIGAPGWKPSMGGVNDSKRQQMLEQKAALDAQKAQNEARRQREEEQQKEADRRKEEKERIAQEKEDEEKRAEKRKKEAFQEQSARELAALQDKREQEALARKNRARRPDHHEDQAPPAAAVAPAPAPRVKPAAEAPRRSYGEGEPSPRTDYDHIRSPLRDAIRDQQARDAYAQQQQQQQQHAKYRRDAPGISMYQPASADAVDSFVRSFQGEQRGPPPYWGGPAAPYAPPPQYGASPYASYSQAPAAYGGYPQPYPPAHQQPPYPSLHLQPGSFYPPNMHPDQSLHSESRLVPVNPWSSSDILSSYAPVGAKAVAAANAAAQAQAQRLSKHQAAQDMEKSMASESTMVYLKAMTPAGTERPRTRPQAMHAAAPAADLRYEEHQRPPTEPHKTARSTSTPADARLSELLAETNRMIEYESALAHVQKKEVMGAGSEKRGPPQMASDGSSPKNRIAAGKKPSYDFGERDLGENDGISTVVRQDSRAKFAQEVAGVLEDIPPARNRIFLGQKTDDSDFRGSADEGSVPIRPLVQGTSMATQTSVRNLLDLAGITGPTAGVQGEASAQSSPRTEDGSSPRTRRRRHSSFVKPSKHDRDKDHHGQHGHRHHHKSPREHSPRIDELGSPMQPMALGALSSPMKPIRATSAGNQARMMPAAQLDPPAEEVAQTPQSFKAMPGQGGDLAEMLRRDALNSPAVVEVRALDHRSPRQRAADNMQIRQAHGAAPRTKFPEPEPEEAPLPHYTPRERGNVLSANAQVIKAPGAYKSPRERAMGRQQQQQEDETDVPASLEGQQQRQKQKQLEDEQQALWNSDVPDATEDHEQLYKQRQLEDEQQAMWETDVTGSIEDQEQLQKQRQLEDEQQALWQGGDESYGAYGAADDGSYVVSSAEDLYAAGYDEEQAAAEAPLQQVPQEDYGYVVDSAENLYGGEGGDYYGEQGAGYGDEGYVVPSAEDMYGDRQEQYYGEAPGEDEAYVVPSAEDMYGAGGYDDYADGGGGHTEESEQPIASARSGRSGTGAARYAPRPGTGEAADTAHETPGSSNNASPRAAGASPRDGAAGGRRNVLSATADVIKPGADHRSPRQRALDNKAAREAAQGSTPSPRAPVVPFEELKAQDVALEPEHVRQRKNVLDATEAILRPAVTGHTPSPRGRPHHSAGSADHAEENNPAPGELVPHTPPIASRPTSGRPRTGQSRVASHDASLDGVAAFEQPGRSRPASGRLHSLPTVDPDRDQLKAADVLGTAVAQSGQSAPPSRPLSSRPRTGQTRDALDDVVAHTETSRPASSRPRTAQSAAVQTHGDALDNEVTLANLALGSRPTSSRPRTGRASAQDQSAGQGDVLDQAVTAGSRPASSGRNLYQS